MKQYKSQSASYFNNFSIEQNKVAKLNQEAQFSKQNATLYETEIKALKSQLRKDKDELEK